MNDAHAVYIQKSTNYLLQVVDNFLLRHFAFFDQIRNCTLATVLEYEIDVIICFFGVDKGNYVWMAKPSQEIYLLNYGFGDGIG